MVLTLWILYGGGLLALLCLADYFGRNLEQLRSVEHPKLLALWQTQALQTIPFYALFWLGLVPGVLLLAPFPVFSNGGLQGQDVAKEIFLAICWLVFAVRVVISAVVLACFAYGGLARMFKPHAP